MSLNPPCPGSLVLFASLLAAASATAQTYTWQGDINTNWETPGNWAGSAVPVSGSGTRLVFGAAPSPSIVNDIGFGLFTLNRLDFTAAAPAYTLSGLPLEFRSTGSTGPRIVHDGVSTVTLSVSAALVNTVTLSGSGLGALNLNGVLGGSGGLILNRVGVTTLGHNANTFTGMVHVQGPGILSLATVSNNGTAQPLGLGSIGSPKLLLGSGGVTGILRFTGTSALYNTDHIIGLWGATTPLTSPAGIIDIVNPTTTVRIDT
jgi:hypothetical protein